MFGDNSHISGKSRRTAMLCSDGIRNCKCGTAGNPKLQKHAPFFKGQALVDYEFKEISLASYQGKFLVLFFYPMDFTFVCPTEIIAFSDRSPEFANLNAEVVGCSTDSVYSHFAWTNTPRKQGGLGDMKIPLLSDKTMQISRDYGVLDEDTGIAFRGVFIIDKASVLRQMTVNDLPIGRNIDEILRLIQAIQFADENGEVCPVNWKPGEKTFKPTNEGLQNFMEGQQKP